MNAYRCRVEHGGYEPVVYHGQMRCDEIPEGWYATKQEAIDAAADELERYGAACERASWFRGRIRDPMNSRFD
jgi:hypothetical protein